MTTGKRTATVREKMLLRRCILLMLGTLFFFMLAAIRARSGDYYNPENDPWYSPEEDEVYSAMSADDHILASRMRRGIIGNRATYQRRKASRRHDSVTIVVRESTESEITSSNDLKRDGSSNMTLTNWLTPSFSGGLGARQHGEQAGGNTPTFSWSTGRTHKSDSSIERTQYFTSTLTGEVTDVYPNGYLVIQARKRVNVNGEEQTMLLTGIVNPTHMDSNSSVNADYIMDMAITYTGSGPMTRMDKRGWGAKAFDFLNPF